MKKLIPLMILIAIFSCNSKSDRPKILPDTCFTQVTFKNIYAAGYPKPTNTATAVRVIKDTANIDGDRVIHLLDTGYYLSYGVPIASPSDPTGRTPMKSILNPKDDSIRMVYYLITTKDIIVDYNKTDPYRPSVTTSTSDTLAKSKDGNSSIVVETSSTTPPPHDSIGTKHHPPIKPIQPK